MGKLRGGSSVGRMSPFQGEGRRFESGPPLQQKIKGGPNVIYIRPVFFYNRLLEQS